MQILFLADTNSEATINKEVLSYKKSLKQNILYAEELDLYEKDGFIYSKKIIVLQTNKIYTDVLLSPSIVINLSPNKIQDKIDGFLQKFWINTQQLFYKPKNEYKHQKNTTEYKLLKSNKSYCYAYMQDCENPSFKVLEDTIHIAQDFCVGVPIKGLRGFIEFSLIEYYAANISIDVNSNIQLGKKSALFLIEFDIHPSFGDYSININNICSVDYTNFINSRVDNTFKYFDSILDFRIDKYASKLYFRNKVYEEAVKNEIEFEPSCKNFFLLIKDNYAGFQKAYFGGVNTQDGLNIANDKHKTNKHLKDAGFNVNNSSIYPLDKFSHIESVEKLNFNYPAVLKPADKQGGYGVFTNLKTPEKLFDAINILKNMNDVKNVIIENFFTGLTYRFFVVGNETKAILKFEFPNIVGDGVNTIDTLIKSKNKVSKSKIKISDVIKLSLADNNYTLHSVLEKGKKLILSYDSHPSLGGGAVDVTEIVDNAYKTLAVKIAKSVKLDVSGVDIMINKKGDYKVIEINTAPAMATHLEPYYGNSINVYKDVMYRLLKYTKIDGNNSFFPNLVYFHK